MSSLGFADHSAQTVNNIVLLTFADTEMNFVLLWIFHFHYSSLVQPLSSVHFFLSGSGCDPAAICSLRYARNKLWGCAACTLFFIRMTGVIQGLLTWEQQVDSTALAPVSGSTSLVDAITFGQWRFHLGSTSMSVCNESRVQTSPTSRVDPSRRLQGTGKCSVVVWKKVEASGWSFHISVCSWEWGCDLLHHNTAVTWH